MWHLQFYVEPGEAELRFRHLTSSFQADRAVESVEVSSDNTEPETRRLTITFKGDYDQPENRNLRYCDKIFGAAPIMRKSRYDRLLADDFFVESR